MPDSRSRRRIRMRRAGLLALAVFAAMAIAACASTGNFASFGGTPDRARLSSSPEFHQGSFVNAEHTHLGIQASGSRTVIGEWLFGKEMRTPTCPLPMVNPIPQLATPSHSGLRVTWLGHSTTLIEIDGSTVLTDPQWSERASPSTLVGPRRFHPPPLALDALPHIDAVLISHDHYDHLDMATVKALAARNVTFHVALGVGAHLAKWGVSAAQIVEHEWWQSTRLASGVEVVSTPARHFSGRLGSGNPTLWTSWTLVGPNHRVFFSGDTGMTRDFSVIGQRFGPFDVAMIEIGQWDPAWGDIHLGPHNALTASLILAARKLLPIHWATFSLGFHAWSQPAEALYTEAPSRGVRLITPLLGEPVEPTLEPVSHPWWRALPPDAPNCPPQ